ncbi:MAG: hypothetical protein MI975_06435, partial [Cytophagales bacterium]|nr:hypothetical protein [Cytophagales bacterium]
MFETTNPAAVLALTSGPAQPEFQSFEPAGTTEMVDLFSGDFTYNIPLFELPGPNGGYPFNLAYQAGIGMDQEASWCGLGWNLSPGAVTRQMRGLPDEFRGDSDQLIKTQSMKPSTTFGVGAGGSVEIFGGEAISIGLGVFNNNYKGVGYSIDGSLGFGLAAGSGLTAGLDFKLNSQEGIFLSPSLSLSKQVQRGYYNSFSLSTGYNSREGLQNMSVGFSMSKFTRGVDRINKEITRYSIQGGGNSSGLSLAGLARTPQISLPMHNTSFSFKAKAGGAWWGVFGAPYVNGF